MLLLRMRNKIARRAKSPIERGVHQSPLPQLQPDQELQFSRAGGDGSSVVQDASPVAAAGAFVGVAQQVGGGSGLLGEQARLQVAEDNTSMTLTC
jgi:hypothetical protein